MNELEVFNSSEDALSKTFFEFTEYLKYYVIATLPGRNKSPKNWLAEDNVINSFFAAIAQYGSEEVLAKRIEKAIKKLLSD